MRHIYTTALKLSIVAILTAAHGPAQDSGWDRLNELKPDHRLRIVLKDRKYAEGSFDAWSAEALQIVTPQGVRTIRMDDVHRVQLRERSSRWKGAMIGSLVGFGIALAIGAPSAGYITDRNNPSASWRAAVGAGLGLYGAAIGAPLGALAGGSRMSTVYRAENRP